MRIMHITLKLLFVAFSIVALCSCGGMPSFRQSVPFPREEITAFAEQVEEVVLNTPRDDPALSDYGEGENEVEIDPMSLMIASDELRERIPALARLNVDNEVMLMAIRGRALRRPAVLQFEQNGCIGENNRALLQYLGGESCAQSRNTRRRASSIVLRENRDRRVIYEQIVQANELGKSAIEPVREIFAEQIHKKAWAGTPLQMPDGTWQRR